MAAENGQTNTVGKEKALYISALSFVNLTVSEVALQLTFLWIYFVKILFQFCCLDFKERAFS